MLCIREDSGIILHQVRVFDKHKLTNVDPIRSNIQIVA